MSSDHPVFILKTPVTTADIDFKKRLRLGSLINLLIQAAIKSADELGFGFDHLKSNNLVWVLSRLTVEIHRPIMWYETIEVETWPKDIDRLLYLRDFVIRTESGEIVAKASSAWLAIDIDSRRPKLIGNGVSELYCKLSDKHALNYQPEKIGDVPRGETYNKEASYSDIDLNNHVTATRYIDWMMDAFPIHFHENNYPAKVSVNYIKETRIGETVFINKSPDNTFEGMNECGNCTAFKGELKF